MLCSELYPPAPAEFEYTPIYGCDVLVFMSIYDEGIYDRDVGINLYPKSYMAYARRPLDNSRTTR
jgi:hypothetical protein